LLKTINVHHLKSPFPTADEEEFLQRMTPEKPKQKSKNHYVRKKARERVYCHCAALNRIPHLVFQLNRFLVAVPTTKTYRVSTLHGGLQAERPLQRPACECTVCIRATNYSYNSSTSKRYRTSAQNSYETIRQQTSGVAMFSLFGGISTFFETNWPTLVAAAALPITLVFAKKQVLIPLYLPLHTA
jgi:hypothetical protein